jgi:hypothetical protein
MTHSALVHWLPPEQRGRKELPATLRYVALSRFAEDGTWPDGAWTVEVRFRQPPAEQGAVCEGDVRFLADGAPEARLKAGARFSLYEGPQMVADIELLD